MNIHMKDTQRDGAVVIVILAIIIYVVIYSFSFFKDQQRNIPYGNKTVDSVIVAITGDTECNGVYYVPENATVSDILIASGAEHIDLFDSKILNTRISTGNAVIIEKGQRLTIREMSNANKVALNIPININNISQDDLILIPGIGEKTALKIVQFRKKAGRFNKLEDLMNIPGIKEKKFAKIKKYFCTDQIL
jgi:competence protein ComEA